MRTGVRFPPPPPFEHSHPWIYPRSDQLWTVEKDACYVSVVPVWNRDEVSASRLKKRTLTTLYNERPAWLDRAHTQLDTSVAAA